MTSHFRHTLRLAISRLTTFTIASLAIALALHMPTSHAQIQHKGGAAHSIPLFLPIAEPSNTAPANLARLKTQLVRILNREGLSDLRPSYSDHWHQYQNSLRRGHLGVYLAAPHFSAWAIHKHKFKAILRVSTPLRYVIATKKTNRHIFEMDDLSKRSVCAQKPLNLDSLLINRAFSNPLLSAEIVSIPDVSAEMNKPYSDCEAFSVSDHLLRAMNLSSPERFIRLQQSQQYNNYALITHPDISEAQIERIKKVFSDEETTAILQPLLLKYSDKPKLINAQQSDYPKDYYQPLLRYWK